MSSFVIAFLLGLVSVTSLASGETIDLSGLSWILHGEDSEGQEVKIPASVPGDVYSDLREAGVLLGDLLYRFNDVEYRWVSQYNWTYQTILHVSETQLGKEVVQAARRGIATAESEAALECSRC